MLVICPQCENEVASLTRRDGHKIACTQPAMVPARKVRTLGEIPWVTRSDIRHTLQMLHSQALEVRHCMADPKLLDHDVSGAVEDINRMISELRAVRRQLTGKKDDSA